MSIAAALLAASLALAVPVGTAEAASRFCRQLEARLAQSGDSGQLRAYEQAAEEQIEELLQAERQAHGRGCFDGAFGRRDPLCPGLIGTLDRMDRNLAIIERQRDLLAQRSNNTRERIRVMDALEANRCYEDEEEVRILPPPLEPNGEPEANDGNVISGPFYGGTFRTLCVRTCDGYYFPISFSVTSDLFDRDERKCQALCPGTDVRLYSHRVPGEESENMLSGSGAPYTELPTAFKYREAGYVRPQGCGCNPAKNFSIIAGEPPAEAEPRIDAQVSLPLPEPAAETPAGNASEASTPDPAAPPKPVAAPLEDDRKVRVVGPMFLPDPEGAIDLRSPGRSEVR